MQQACTAKFLFALSNLSNRAGEKQIPVIYITKSTRVNTIHTGEETAPEQQSCTINATDQPTAILYPEQAIKEHVR